jgi:hypothetical protein
MDKVLPLARQLSSVIRYALTCNLQLRDFPVYQHWLACNLNLICNTSGLFSSKFRLSKDTSGLTGNSRTLGVALDLRSKLKQDSFVGKNVRVWNVLAYRSGRT